MDLQELGKIVKTFDETGIGRCFAILATLAESALDDSKFAKEIQPDEQYLSPQRAANMLEITTETLRKYRERYSLASIGSGKNRRYPKSEVLRVLELRSDSEDVG